MYVVKRVFVLKFFCNILLVANQSYTIDINLIEIPKVPDVQKIAVPGVQITHKDDDVIMPSIPKDEIQVGDVNNGRLSGYLITKYTSDKDFYKILKMMGYEILSTYQVDFQGNCRIRTPSHDEALS